MGARIFAIANQKGGVGKTTTTLSLASALTKEGKRVLVLDLDPHASATIHLAFFPEKLEYTALDLFVQRNSDGSVWSQVIQKQTKHGFDFVPSSVRLSDVESDMQGSPGKGLILRKLFETITDDYDYILMDCPPQVGVILVNAMVAAEEVIIPIQTDFLALHGVKLIFDTIKMINKAMPFTIRYKALPTMYDRRAGACRRVLQVLKKSLKDKVFQTVINTDTNFREASAKGQVILDYAPESRGSLEYKHLARELIQSENA